MGDGRWGGPDTGGGRPNTQKWAERGHIGRNERGDGQDILVGARSPEESRRGEKEGTISSSTGKHRHLTIRGQSLGMSKPMSGVLEVTTL